MKLKKYSESWRLPMTMPDGVDGLHGAGPPPKMYAIKYTTSSMSILPEQLGSPVE